MQSRFPAGSVLTLSRNGVIVFSTQTQQGLQIIGQKLRLGKLYGAPSVLDVADIDTGAWRLRIQNGTNYAEGVLTKSGAGGPFFLTGDLDPSHGLAIGDCWMTLDPTLDNTGTSSGGGGTGGGTLAGAVESAVFDMTGQSDLVPLGIGGGWANGGAVSQGTVGTGSSCPAWYNEGGGAIKNMNHAWEQFLSWWFVNVTSTTNRAANVRVAVRNHVIQILRRSTGAWVEVGRTNEFGADYYADNAQGGNLGPAIQRASAEANGGREFKLSSNASLLNIHGYGIQMNISPYFGDIQNLAISQEFRLVKDDPNGPDDLDSANLLIDVGGDYWPYMDGPRVGGVGYMVGCGSARFRKVDRYWRLQMFSCLSSAREVDRTSVTPASAKTDTESNFRAKPPAFTLLA